MLHVFFSVFEGLLCWPQPHNKRMEDLLDPVRFASVLASVGAGGPVPWAVIGSLLELSGIVGLEGRHKSDAVICSGLKKNALQLKFLNIVLEILAASNFFLEDTLANLPRYCELIIILIAHRIRTRGSSLNAEHQCSVLPSVKAGSFTEVKMHRFFLRSMFGYHSLISSCNIFKSAESQQSQVSASMLMLTTFLDEHKQLNAGVRRELWMEVGEWHCFQKSFKLGLAAFEEAGPLNQSDSTSDSKRARFSEARRRKFCLQCKTMLPPAATATAAATSEMLSASQQLCLELIRDKNQQVADEQIEEITLVLLRDNVENLTSHRNGPMNCGNASHNNRELLETLALETDHSALKRFIMMSNFLLKVGCGEACSIYNALPPGPERGLSLTLDDIDCFVRCCKLQLRLCRETCNDYTTFKRLAQLFIDLAKTSMSAIASTSPLPALEAAVRELSKDFPGKEFDSEEVTKMQDDDDDDPSNLGEIGLDLEQTFAALPDKSHRLEIGALAAQVRELLQKQQPKVAPGISASKEAVLSLYRGSKHVPVASLRATLLAIANCGAWDVLVGVAEGLRGDAAGQRTGKSALAQQQAQQRGLIIDFAARMGALYALVTEGGAAPSAKRAKHGGRSGRSERAREVVELFDGLMSRLLGGEHEVGKEEEEDGVSRFCLELSSAACVGSLHLPALVAGLLWSLQTRLVGEANRVQLAPLLPCINDMGVALGPSASLGAAENMFLQCRCFQERHMPSVARLLTLLMRAAASRLPAGVSKTSWCESMGSVEAVKGDHDEAVRWLLFSAKVAADSKAPCLGRSLRNKPSLVKDVVSQLLRANRNLLAVVLCQVLSPVPYESAFRALMADPSSHNLEDYRFLWNISILEQLVASHSRQGNEGHKKAALQAMGRPMVNENNEPKSLDAFREQLFEKFCQRLFRFFFRI